jgi:hypothetical protein
MLIGCTKVTALRPPLGCEVRAAAPPALVTTLADLVAEYIRDRLPWTLRERETWSALARDVALARAAYGRDPWGNKHSHQYRLTDATLCEAVRLAGERRNLFFNAVDFETLLELSREIQREVFGLGRMWSYDFAQRFGAHLDLAPVDVYVQRDALAGARILNLYVRRGRVVRADLPEGLSVLDSNDVENFLCVYKARLTSSMKRA